MLCYIVSLFFYINLILKVERVPFFFICFSMPLRFDWFGSIEDICCVPQHALLVSVRRTIHAFKFQAKSIIFIPGNCVAFAFLFVEAI